MCCKTYSIISAKFFKGKVCHLFGVGASYVKEIFKIDLEVKRKLIENIIQNIGCTYSSVIVLFIILRNNGWIRCLLHFINFIIIVYNIIMS